MAEPWWDFDSDADPLPGDENSKAKAKVFKVAGRPQGRAVAKCQSQVCEKTEEKHGKLVSAMRNKCIQVPFTLLYGDYLATVHQLTMSPRCLIKLLNQLAWQDCLAGWVVWTFCQSKSQSEIPRNAQNLRSKACTNESKAMIRELVGIHKAQA